MSFFNADVSVVSMQILYTVLVLPSVILALANDLSRLEFAKTQYMIDTLSDWPGNSKTFLKRGAYMHLIWE